jgi:hypothetical protein
VGTRDACFPEATIIDRVVDGCFSAVDPLRSFSKLSEAETGERGSPVIGSKSPEPLDEK